MRFHKKSCGTPVCRMASTSKTSRPSSVGGVEKKTSGLLKPQGPPGATPTSQNGKRRAAKSRVPNPLRTKKNSRGSQPRAECDRCNPWRSSGPSGPPALPTVCGSKRPSRLPQRTVHDNPQTGSRGVSCREFVCHWHPIRPSDPTSTRQHRPQGSFGKTHPATNKHTRQLARLPPAGWSIRIAWTPISKHQRRRQSIRVQNDTLMPSVALRRGPVNHFQAEGAPKFRDGNSGRTAFWQCHLILIGSIRTGVFFI